MLEEPDERVFVADFSNKVQQLFLHVPGPVVLCCTDISLSDPVKSLKKFLPNELQNRANFYTARNKKLKTELSFYEQDLKNECNIFIRFNEGLVGGSGNFPLEPSGDYLQDDSVYAEYQPLEFTEFHPGHGYQGGYQSHRHQPPILQNPAVHIRQQFPPEPYTVNYHQYNEILYPGYDQNVEANLPSYNPRMSYVPTGGHTYRGSKTNSRQRGRGAQLRYPGPSQNQFHRSSLLPASTIHRTPTSPVEKEFQHNAGARSPPRLNSHSVVTSSETKSVIASNSAINVEGSGNITINTRSAQVMSTSPNTLKSNENVMKISDGNDNTGVSGEADASCASLVLSDDITQLNDYSDVTISKLSIKKSDLDNPAESSISRSSISSSSKVFSPGLASRDIGDTFSESPSSATFAISVTNVEISKSLAGKPVIQASDKESSVTDVMNHEFKPLTTGDFMLTLKCRQFYEIPSEILSDHRCKHTTKISISSNRLREIPKYLDIDHFPSMKILDASKNKLVDLPASIAEFLGMENLDISHNQCRIFPDVISKLKRLKILKVNNNSIEYVQKGLGFYNDLEILRLEGNKLTHIPEDIKYLQSLQYLNISDNRLDDFPQVICQLKSLQFLYMSSNKIKEVPHYLYMNESLEVVQVDKNPIIKPPPDVLARPIQEIRRYCKEIVAGRFKDDRILIIVQGSSNSGKSSVCSALCSDVTQRAVKPTEGIEERSAVIRDINVTIRDFSGDAHYKGLTEIFIVHNALYILTVDLKEYNTNVDNQDWFEINVWHYLKKIGVSQTVFIVGTHADLLDEGSVEGLLERLIKKAETALKNENKLLHLMKGSVNKTIDSFDLLKDEVTRCLLDRSLFPERG
ncbi:uncharacterized protein LOC117123401, partial [Anneissia japonica]|uniref:uncharacterized protein LOC117123401 n=1 Tax=Anneissia japonica TaxID=1529436 RepID=UPI0014254D31